MERIEFDERLHEGILRRVAGVFERTDHVHQSRKQPVLILRDQLSERRRATRKSFVDELVVSHVDHTETSTRRPGRKFPARQV